MQSHLRLCVNHVFVKYFAKNLSLNVEPSACKTENRMELLIIEIGMCEIERAMTMMENKAECEVF